MNAIELEADIDENNELHLKLPSQHRGKHARVIVLVDTGAPTTLGNLDAFLASMPINADGRKREEIDAQVQEERDSWDRP